MACYRDSFAYVTYHLPTVNDIYMLTAFFNVDWHQAGFIHLFHWMWEIHTSNFRWNIGSFFLIGVRHGFPQPSWVILAYHLETDNVVTDSSNSLYKVTFPHTTLTKNRKYRNEIFRKVTGVEIRNTLTVNELHVFNLRHKFRNSNSNLNNQWNQNIFQNK
jgi:hypothetical protein